MSVQRIIPVLLHKHGRLVLSRGFGFHHDIGSPFEISRRLKSWDLDELVILDISSHWPLKGGETNKDKLFENFCETINVISKNCFVPLAVGGGIQSVNHVRQIMRVGADRIVINSESFNNPALITDVAAHLGAQAVIASVDVKRHSDSYYVYSCGGQQREEVKFEQWMKQLQNLRAGEILIQSMDQDGKANGYDHSLLSLALNSADIPVIICGGAGCPDDISKVLKKGAKAAGAANIFNFLELSYKRIKDDVEQKGVKLRPSSIHIDYIAEKKGKVSKSRFDVENETIWQELAKTGLME